MEFSAGVAGSKDSNEWRRRWMKDDASAIEDCRPSAVTVLFSDLTSCAPLFGFGKWLLGVLRA